MNPFGGNDEIQGKHKHTLIKKAKLEVTTRILKVYIKKDWKQVYPPSLDDIEKNNPVSPFSIFHSSLLSYMYTTPIYFLLFK